MKRLYHALISTERAVAAALLLATLGLVLLQVFTRYVVGQPLSWSEELARYMLVWLTFMAAAYCMSQRLHISVDLLVARLSKKSAAVVDAIANSLVVVASGTLAVSGALFAAEASRNLAPATGLPMGFVYAAGALGFGLMALHGVINAIRDVRDPDSVPDAMEGIEGVA